ncbi:hypothetical protein ACJIZ3_011255 [Penstemon smallii]|uniref:Retrovirus-related Pol polyprotein from transposon TNT 1-94-like beta-barrel domain-containing protein n=1 Tax=Penstemon smallii TaxID=265156 RepID=A0ABD3ULT8_9LAMI
MAFNASSSPLTPSPNTVSAVSKNPLNNYPPRQYPPLLPTPNNFGPRPPSIPAFKRKDRPFCLHCNLAGHTKDTCYKLHGYPLATDPTFRGLFRNTNQIASSIPPQPSTNLQGFFQGLSSDQYNSLASRLATHLPSGQLSNNNTSSFNVTSTSGICSSSSNLEFTFDNNTWLLDSRATNHICNNISIMHSVLPCTNVSVTLPNNTSFLVTKIGIIYLGVFNFS